MNDQDPSPVSAARTPTVTPAVVLTDAEALREHLDTLNEHGVTPLAVGIDAWANPFLITLIGPYAESEHVFFDSPWQGDIDWRNGHRHCEECMGHVHGIEDLRYPVTLMANAKEVLP
jgi:hypothetical protein